MKRARQVVASALTVAALVVGIVAFQIARLEPTSLPIDADAALVLGAAVWGDEPSPVFQARIDHAIGLLRTGTVDRIVFTGGASSDSIRTEAEVARAYALAKGVPERAISMESVSRTTAQNLACTLPILHQLDVEAVVLVSDPLHLWRARWMAQDLGLSVRVSPTPTTRYQSLSTQGRFLARETYFSLVYAAERLAGPPACPGDTQ